MSMSIARSLQVDENRDSTRSFASSQSLAVGNLNGSTGVRGKAAPSGKKEAHRYQFLTRETTGVYS